jgi:hypothetical protein
MNGYLRQWRGTVHVIHTPDPVPASLTKVDRPIQAACGEPAPNSFVSWMPFDSEGYNGWTYYEEHGYEFCYQCLWRHFMPETEADGSEAYAPH